MITAAHACMPARLPQGHPPVLLVIVDTEEEFDWSRPFSRQSTGTSAIPAQQRAHDRIYARLGIVPTYVIDWPVATTPASVRYLRGLQASGQCDIGTHLHPWVSPPHQETVSTFNSYAGNLPRELEFEKLRLLTEAISENFVSRPVTFKAGRYGLGPHTLRSIAELGYEIDASIVPHTSFTSDGGPDFSSFSEHPFWIEHAGRKLLELPVTTAFCGLMRDHGPALYPKLATNPLKLLRAGAIASRTGLLERIRLTPEGCSQGDMTRLTSTLVRHGCQVLSLTYHSPSLAPGHTPYTRTEDEVERFLDTIEACCLHFRDELGGTFMGLRELHRAMSTHSFNASANSGNRSRTA